jgi:ATP-dependent DNA helicase PIF1
MSMCSHLISSQVRALLRPCESRRLHDVDGIAAARLVTHRADAQRLNDTQLQGLSGERQTFTARDEGRDAEALATLRSACPAPSELTLKVGAQVILTKTLDADAGLVNGARGVVTRFTATRHPSVRMYNGVERTMRLEAFGLSQVTLTLTLTLTLILLLTLTVTLTGGVRLSQGGQIVACRMALPLALAWAISIHKSQGVCALTLTSPSA